ncbi:C40 family peptidase [Aneurinibacillus aneurinilyticus]|uniref:C40 family peptidase n=2 Tax=Aneurinibacillus aneurinilyticus TaxID=1391 RepID=A0A848CZP3_ANEAE|nr:C40 family peptidase [Aneurinibacillus aneurinilyticus]MCI1693214.1 C40 family peptidase [Aneurinibacillus aneurinilyticus]MED0671195.1 C40 family peptidase [Aneurinibacillus aneurinilyticus]MED0705000.1 C40 family peptidase [Aneurinibacillus aneurinilyticus]MED0721801.1 C40 family peptidase [Aneurinibacillus aneurinilyticus]MED0732741.1 C40 family peptidase [Aneurinibacillus aneurinilyticus]
MRKHIKAITAGCMAAGILLGGMAVPGSVSAANVSAKVGSSVDIKNENQVINNIISTGKSLMGKAKYSHKYTAGKYMDCSGFTYYIFKKNGIDLHTRWDDGQAKYGSYVPKSQLKKGDLVFFSTNKNKQGITHVGVYLGNGKLLDMANSKRNVAISDLNWSWYKKYYKTAKRVIK